MLFLKAAMVTTGNQPGTHAWLEVSDNDAVSSTWQKSINGFGVMCVALRGDIQSAQGSGVKMLNALRDIEAGKINYLEADGNAFVMYITPHEVWFECLYDDVDESPVSFRQYKLAVETWVKFLADPERKPIVVPFPDDVLDRATLPPRPPRNEE